MNPVPLEDNAADVLGKALRGWRLAPADLARRAGIAPEALQDALDGTFAPGVLAALAPHLKLNADRLEVLARLGWAPLPRSIPGLDVLNLPAGDAMRVNAIVLRDPSGEAALFDTAYDASPLLEFAARHGLRVRHLLLTHEHEDHVDDAPRVLREVPGCRAWSSRRGPVAGTETFEDGATWQLGTLRITARPTPGHAPGGTTFLVDGLAARVAIVGDAIFASSMGGSRTDFPGALEAVRREILSLPADTVLVPGHGPLTTVGEELAHNPFL